MADPWTGGPSLARNVDQKAGSHLRWNVATEGLIDLGAVRRAVQDTLGAVPYGPTHTYTPGTP
eukprot:3032942-Pyramimonas_sp.AAC.1